MEKVEALLAHLSDVRERLTRVPVILMNLRQSVLVAACSGRLTQDWRSFNPNAESGHALLDKVKEGLLKSSKTERDRNLILKCFELPLPTDEDLGIVDQVRTEYAPCLIGMIGHVKNGSTPSRKNSNYWKGSIPSVSSGEVRNTVIHATNERITEAGGDPLIILNIDPSVFSIRWEWDSDWWFGEPAESASSLRLLLFTFPNPKDGSSMVQSRTNRLSRRSA